MPHTTGLVRAFGALLLFLSLFSAVSLCMRGALTPEEERAVSGDLSTVTVVLDAGHGGEDGGAVGVNGVYEKDLNFALTRRLGALLEEAGVCVVYTRTEDKMLYSEAEGKSGRKKFFDLRNRLALARAQENPVLVSIHMNKFTVAKYSGLQVYYSGARPESRALAAAVQDTVRETMQPENKRQIKQAGDNIYLLDKADIPAVLIECGFLSNPAECEALSSEDYQNRLSYAIFCGIMEYLNA